MQRKLPAFESVHADLKRVFDQLGVKYVLIGGVAVAAHGIAARRLTLVRRLSLRKKNGPQ